METFKIVGDLHVNFTIVVYSPTNITSLFYPVYKFSYFCICDTPLNCYYFSHQSHPCAHLTSFRRIAKFTYVKRDYFATPISAIGAVWCNCAQRKRLSTIKLFSKNRMHRILKLELELQQTNNACAMF